MEQQKLEQALRMHMRWPLRRPDGSGGGQACLEDLYELPLSALDESFKTLKRRQRNQEEESFLQRSTVNEMLQLQIEILEFIMTVKQEEADVARQYAEQALQKRQKKMQVSQALAAKQVADLNSKSVEELQKMLEEL